MTDKQAGESSADSEYYLTASDISSKKLRASKNLMKCSAVPGIQSPGSGFNHYLYNNV